MEGDKGRSKGASRAAWLLMNAKVSVAVVIIKNRPAGMSGREFAEALASRLRVQDRGWKDKAEALQQEVLRLQQEMLITRATTDMRITEVAEIDNADDDMSQDLFGPGSSVYSAELQPDGESETPKDLLTAPELPPRLLPSPFPHVCFLQSLCALHRVEGNRRGLEALWFSPDGDMVSVLVDTVCQLLDPVVAACRDPPALGPPDLVLQACQVAARAMELFCSQRMPSVELVRRVEEALRELTQMLLYSHQPGQVQGSSGLDQFPVHQYQNSCHLFWILEKLLQKSEVDGCRLEAMSEQMDLLSQLEQHVFLLSEEFPLFSIYMWRIGGLLTASHR
ncbi:meiosis-specific protein MEI4 isoform X4 [Melanotaenia boesemani]|uniref:meiosis-specific protein MEI4 isoform X4 n=1 Tax=Melanotaenia boesemani TaxID=1250792 RepID=UPI001C048D71|nr:meiosis-specific protein MEI4 isoform X4 [Melanotaenia boesemani]